MTTNFRIAVSGKEKDILSGEVKLRQNRIDEINVTVSSLEKIYNELTVICGTCNGKGEVKKRSCAEDEGTYYPCNSCNGTGKINAV